MKTLMAALASMAMLLGVGMATGTADAATATPLPVVYNFLPCFNGVHNFACPQTRPHGISFGNGCPPNVSGLRWQNWLATSASGTGTVRNCHGSFGAHMYLHGIRSHSGHRYFYLMTLRWGRTGLERFTYSSAGGTLIFWH